MKKVRNQIPFIMLGGENGHLPLYRQIYEAIREAILSGEFVSRMRLPASRALAENLGVSRITVVNAYEQLFAEGYLEGKTGSGTYVAAKLPDDLLQTDKTLTDKRKSSSSGELNLSPFGQKLLPKKNRHPRPPDALSLQPFQHGLTAVDHFPFEIWSRLAGNFYKKKSNVLRGYSSSRGFLPLRRAIADYLKSARGVNCGPQQVIITSGAQQALDLTARIFLSETDAALIENPCYLEARNSFAATGAQIVPIETDGEGFNPEKIPARTENAKLVYVTPSHQYPLGTTMSLGRRLALLDWAREKNAWILEDDYDSEFRYSGRPLASLQGLDKAGRVIYIGTFSKTIFPSLRIGCAVVPPELIDVFTHARALNDVHSSLLEQAVLAEFIAEGHFARHVRRMRFLYERRQQMLVEECEKQLAGLLEVKRSNAGMHLVGWLPKGVDDRAMAKKAADNGVKVHALSEYFSGKMPRGGFILGYTAFDETQIRESIAKLREIF